MNRFNNVWNEVVEELFHELPAACGELTVRSASNGSQPMMRYRRPIADVMETEKEYIVTLELPGVDKKDIDINTKNDLLEIKVERTVEIEQENSYARRQAGFYRALTLPENADVQLIEANYNNGVLELKLPKKPSTTTKIPVK